MTSESVAEQLRRDRERTRMQIGELTQQFEAIVASSAFDAVDDEHDPDGATIGFERAQTAALLDAARRHLAEVEDALDRVRTGTYGVCASCGAG
jgi:DnaK suppressor protein